MMEHIAWEYLDPIQKAQLAATRPEVYERIRQEHKDEQRLNKKEGDKNARE